MRDILTRAAFRPGVNVVNTGRTDPELFVNVQLRVYRFTFLISGDKTSDDDEKDYEGRHLEWSGRRYRPTSNCHINDTLAKAFSNQKHRCSVPERCGWD